MNVCFCNLWKCYKYNIFVLLLGLEAADLPGADVVVEGEETVEEHAQPHHGRRQQPARVEPWNKETK